jgi:hypothetical protein
LLGEFGVARYTIKAMAVIDEPTAWAILDRYVQDCLQIDRDSLLAVYATGSLGGGYYRPGQSDIDAVLIVKDGSEEIWGDLDAFSKPLEALNQAYKARYGIPKDFGPFALQEGELYPPYPPEWDVLALEIARLKVQGVCVYGHYDLGAVPMPTAEDFRQGARRFERWFRDEFVKSNPIETFSGAACVNTILMHLGRYLRIERGVIEFNKRLLIARYLENDPPFVDVEAFRLVNDSLASRALSEKELERLRQAVRSLRAQMNAYLGIQTFLEA